MQLLDLPAELISLLPQYLSSLQDLYSLLQTSRIFYRICMSSNAALPPVFPKLHGQSLLPPHPHLLIAGTARQIADWAVQSVNNRSELYEKLLRGNEGLVELAENVTRLTLKEIKALYAVKGDLLYELTRIIETDIGRESMPESADTVCEDPELALLNWWIYCDLFHHDIDYSYRRSLISQKIAPLKSAIRGRWLAYCMPDQNNRSRPDYKEVRTFQILDQVELWCDSHLIRKGQRQLKHFWMTGEIVPYFDAEWDRGNKYQERFINVAMALGKDSLEMLLPREMPKFKKRLEEIRQLVKLVDTEDIDSATGSGQYDETVWWDSFSCDINQCMGW